MHGKVEGYSAVTSIIGEHMCGANAVMGAYGWAIGTYGALSAAVAITNFPAEAGTDAGVKGKCVTVMYGKVQCNSTIASVVVTHRGVGTSVADAMCDGG